MKNNSMRTLIASLATVAMVVVGVDAFAGQGRGGQNGDGGIHHRRGGNCPNDYRNPDLTPEQRQQMDAARQAYVDATQQDRQDLYANRLALRAEVAKRNPDPQKAADIQKAVSELQSTLDRKRLKHIMALRKINPDAGRGFLMGDGGRDGHGMSDGRWGRRGMGHANCRYQ
ncbi:MAG: periplasmic heavy metal sensor [Desulfosarcina sp.]